MLRAPAPAGALAAGPDLPLRGLNALDHSRDPGLQETPPSLGGVWATLFGRLQASPGEVGAAVSMLFCAQRGQKWVSNLLGPAPDGGGARGGGR